MIERNRRKRAILRDRRRDNRDEAQYGPPLIRALTGFDLYLVNQYKIIQSVARAVRPPGMTREQMDHTVAELWKERIR